MQFLFSSAIVEIGEQIGLDTVNISAHNLRVRRWINDAREWIGEQPYNFNILQFQYDLRIYNVITGGTVSVSADGYEVTGSNTTFTNTPKPYSNCWFTVSGSFDRYRIFNVVDNTHLLLDTPYALTSTASPAAGTASALGYDIWRKYYPLPYAVKRLAILKEFTQPRELRYVPPHEFQYYYTLDRLNEAGMVLEAYTIWGTDDNPVTYSYTINTTAGSNVVSASTSFLIDDIKPGTVLYIVNTAFNIQKTLTYDSVLLNQVVAVTTASTVATANCMGRMYVEFGPNLDNNQDVSLMGWKKVFPLINTGGSSSNQLGDFIEEGWWPVVRAFAIMRGYEYLKRPIGEKQELFQQAFQALVRNQKLAQERMPRFKPFFDRRYSRFP